MLGLIHSWYGKSAVLWAGWWQWCGRSKGQTTVCFSYLFLVEVELEPPTVSLLQAKRPHSLQGLSLYLGSPGYCEKYVGLEVTDSRATIWSSLAGIGGFPRCGPFSAFK